MCYSENSLQGNGTSSLFVRHLDLGESCKLQEWLQKSETSQIVVRINIVVLFRLEKLSDILYRLFFVVKVYLCNTAIKNYEHLHTIWQKKSRMLEIY